MRQTVAKGLRRDLRRAMGPTAIQTIDAHASRIMSVQNDVIALAADHAEFKQESRAKFARMDAERETTEKAVKLAHQDHASFVTRGFWARLSWLLLGE